MDILTYILSKKYTDKIAATLAGGLKYQGSKNTVADLPAASESIKGHMYTVVENGHEYVCDGTQWVDLGADLTEIKNDLAVVKADYLKNADKTELQNNITQEVNNRTTAINTVNDSINQEATAREQADTTLQNNINLKQDSISDLDDIRDGAAKGKTAIQEHQDISGKVDKELTNANGKAQILNESDGGGIFYVRNSGDRKSFVGVNDSTEGGPDAQIYAIDPSNSNYGAKLDILKDGIYYTVGSDGYAARIKDENKLITKKDIVKYTVTLDI